MTDKHDDHARPSDTWLSLEEAIRYTVGAASTCWRGGTGEAEFDTDQAIKVGQELERYITIKHDTMLNPNRSKGEKIVADCLIHGEPFFVFRARDIFAPMVLKRYLTMLEEYGPDDPDFQSNIVEFLGVLKKWQTENVATVRYPD